MLEFRSVLVGCLACLTLTLAFRQEAVLSMDWDELASELQEERSKEALAVAEVYTQLLVGGDLEGLVRASAVPYALDRKQVLESPEEVREAFRKVTSKGPLDLRVASSEVIANRRGIGDACVPLDFVIVRVRFEGGGDDHADYCIRMGAAPKVVGFSD